ncbi:RagB/SusD family nutrient uptake outer membrane protein [Limibacterium fermenti]|jgi:hypothetical protein|uniref:RagB/SusD family nutrient uptake outer membrane protein n=1 Tax=Limibacterium fermenti TaxID=3229863 RepID=UPI000E86B0F2|nr:RagB/SusD family nutrient uptake outer membrane protein [Porphyromonadaceae bacterium]
MKNLIKIVTATLFLMGMVSCDFLDVVPKDTPTLEHVFSNRSVTEKFLRTCYSHLPDPTDPLYYPTYFTSRDEFDWGLEERAGRSVAGQIASGYQNTNDPYQNYWSGRQGGDNLYTAIRDCNTFLENIYTPQDIEASERVRWIAEVKFLKAYYHFFLMELYGPIVLAKDNFPLDASGETVRLYREPVDECVDYIVELLDEAISDLPLTLPDPASEQGRISQTIALAVKAKVLTWAASPLFNGNTDYKGWIDSRGKQLISDTPDPSKWERAATAIKNAIDTCHLAGLKLYDFNKYATANCYNMNDTLVQLMTIRKAITEDVEKNTGVIWATQETFAGGKGGSNSLGFSVLGDMLRMLFPYLYAQDQRSYVNYYYASWHMSELFYTNNGVPMDEDKNFDYSDRYGLQMATPGDKHESYIATGETTVKMHFNREPRFYADLGFDRGYFELATTTNNGGASFNPFFKMRPGEVKGENKIVGYTPKKIIPFESSCSQGDDNKSYTPYDYRFPLIRLSDLYLLYSEALNEVKGTPDDEVYYWIDEVRKHAGLKGVVESWRSTSTNPNKPSTKNGMREIIQKERLIELAFEGQRFWDVRRWKIADKYWTLTPTKWSDSKVAEEYYVPVKYAPTRQVTFKDYLYPLRNYDIRVNTNLVQTYGWQ